MIICMNKQFIHLLYNEFFTKKPLLESRGFEI